MQYLDFLDGLRAVAITAVVFYHLNSKFIPNGFLGVDIFFVISGFIVSYAVAGRGPLPFWKFVADFYARRFLRILPALIVCVLATGFISFLFIPDAWLSNSQDSVGAAALLGFSNIILAKGTDYFSPITEFNPFTHTWSLGVEEQFYFLFPILFFPFLAQRARFISSLFYVLGFVASLLIWHKLTFSAPLNAFYMFYARFWELAAGVLCFQLGSALPRREYYRGRGSAATVVTASIALVVLFTTLFVKLSTDKAWISNVLAVLSSVLLIFSLQRLDLSKGFSPFAIFRIAPVRALGKISYSLYLWHWPVFVVARWTAGLETALQLGFALAVTMSLSLLSYKFIETPFREWRFPRRVSRYATVAAGIAFAATSWTAFNFASHHKKSIALSKVMKHELDWKADIGRATFPDLPGCLAPGVINGLEIHYARMGCGTTTLSEKVYLLGDSHSFVYENMMRRFTLITGIETVHVLTDGCTFLSLQWNRDSDQHCAPSIKRAVADLYKNVKRGDLIFLPSLRLPRLAEQFAQFTDEFAIQSVYGPGRDKDRAKAIENAVEILKPLSDKGAKFLFEAPLPVFRSPGFRCSDWFNRNNPACSRGSSIDRDFILWLRAPTIDAFSKIASNIENVGIWDPLPTICPESTCHAFKDGKPLFFDGDHISGYSAILLTSSFVGAANAELGKQYAAR